MKNITVLSFLLFANLVFGQFVDLGQKVIGGSGDDYLTRYEDTLNNSSYLVGHSYSNISFDKSENSRGENDIWIIKLDENDQKIWDKTIGGDLSDYTSECFFLDNKIYILGNSRSSISGEKTMNSFAGFDWWMVVIDTNGNLLWQKQYGGNHNDYLRKHVVLNNGNILLVGTSQSSPSATIGNKTSPNIGNIGNEDYWLVEINPTDGAIVQQKTIGTISPEYYLNDVKVSSSGKIIIKGGAWCGLSGDKTDFGYSSPNSGGISTNMWVITLDQNLNILNDKCFGSGGEGGSGSMLLTDSAYYFAVDSNTGIGGNKTAPNRGCINSNNCSDYWVVKTDTNLNIIWDQSFGGNNNDYPANIAFFTSDKLILSGISNSEESGNKTTQQYGGFDDWFLILNKIDGTIVTQKTYGGTSDESGILGASLSCVNSKESISEDLYIKETIIAFANIAKSYKAENQNSFSGLCASESYLMFSRGLQSAVSKPSQCLSTGTTYAVFSPLSTGEYACIDTTSKYTVSSSPLTTTSCK